MLSDCFIVSLLSRPFCTYFTVVFKGQPYYLYYSYKMLQNWLLIILGQQLVKPWLSWPIVMNISHEFGILLSPFHHRIYIVWYLLPYLSKYLCMLFLLVKLCCFWFFLTLWLGQVHKSFFSIILIHSIQIKQWVKLLFMPTVLVCVLLM